MLYPVLRGVRVAAAALAAWVGLSGHAFATFGQPAPWQIGMQPTVTPIGEQIVRFHDFLFYIIAAIVLFVFVLLAFVIVRYNERANPKPGRATHNTAIEVIWTVVPILILLAISVPSFRLLFAQYDFPEADLTIKATGHQWYWSYEYPDHEGVSFDAVMVEEVDLKPGQPRLLTTDNNVVVPVNKNVHVLVTASDVIHNWTVPAFGSKIDAVPGKLLRTWFRAERVGTYYGQCSELCGARHAFMPIAVKVVSEAEFAAWLQQAKAQANGNSNNFGSNAREHASLNDKSSPSATAERERTE
jgi:cytochrome c oxidase subunit 2